MVYEGDKSRRILEAKLKICSFFLRQIRNHEKLYVRREMWSDLHWKTITLFARDKRVDIVKSDKYGSLH